MGEQQIGSIIDVLGAATTTGPQRHRGAYIRLEPLDGVRHGDELYEAGTVLHPNDATHIP